MPRISWNDGDVMIETLPTGIVKDRAGSLMELPSRLPEIWALRAVILH